MLVAQDIINNIDAIIERAYLDFTYFLTGDELLTDEQKFQVEAMGLLIGRRPLIELLYLLVRQRSSEGYHADTTLRTLLDSISASGVLPVINDAHFASMVHAKRELFDAIISNKSELQKKIKRKIQLVNEEIRKDELVNKVPPPEKREERDNSAILGLMAFVGLAVKAAHSDFLRDLTVAMTNTITNGVLDEASLRSEDLSEAKVFKTVVNDGSLCQWCNKFYTFLDGRPKIYTVKELMANGTNDGKPKSQWKPVLGSTHPRCRCQLHYVNTPNQDA